MEPLTNTPNELYAAVDKLPSRVLILQKREDWMAVVPV